MDYAIRRATIAVPTRGRRSLAELVHSLQREAERSPFGVDVVLFGNGNPEEVSHVQDESLELGCSFVPVPGPGLARVRNCMLEYALSSGIDVLICIDDDEIPVSGWLDAHLRAMMAYHADVVVGPVQVRLDPGAPRWLAGGRLLRQPIERPSGRYQGLAYSGNTLIRVKLLRQVSVRFDPAFDTSGGEDTLFFERLSRAGAKLAWSSEALAWEHPDLDRVTFLGVLRSAVDSGMTTVALERIFRPQRPWLVSLRRVGRLVRGSWLVLFGATRLRSDICMRGLVDACFVWGVVLAAFGRRSRRYG
jgi:succinoglycan biosynthesis protein ExoM